LFEYGCFISYAHPKEGSMMKAFIDDLAVALQSELDPYVPDEIYIDRERLKPGFRFTPALSYGLCASACWIVVYVPEYARREYCRREFRAMQILEERRRRELGRHLSRSDSMIIPIVVRGTDEELPEQIKTNQYIDFKHLTLANATISDSTEAMQQISDVAAGIHRMYRLGEHLNQNCEQFEIPSLDGDEDGFTPVTPRFPGDPRPNGDGA
jgi:TIR domain-containing protein